MLRRIQHSTLAELESLLDGVLEESAPLNFTSLYSLYPTERLTVAHYQKIYNIDANIGKCLFSVLLGVGEQEANKVHYEMGRKYNSFIIEVEKKRAKRRYCTARVNKWLASVATTRSFSLRPGQKSSKRVKEPQKYVYDCPCCGPVTPGGASTAPATPQQQGPVEHLCPPMRCDIMYGQGLLDPDPYDPTKTHFSFTQTTHTPMHTNSITTTTPTCTNTNSSSSSSGAGGDGDGGGGGGTARVQRPQGGGTSKISLSRRGVKREISELRQAQWDNEKLKKGKKKLKRQLAAQTKLAQVATVAVTVQKEKRKAAEMQVGRLQIDVAAAEAELKAVKQEARLQSQQAQKEAVRAKRREQWLQRQQLTYEERLKLITDKYHNVRVLKNIQANLKRSLQKQVDQHKKTKEARKQKKSFGKQPLSRLDEGQQEQVKQYQLDAVLAMEAMEDVEAEMTEDGMLSLLTVQKRGQPHSGEMIELCLKLMARAISAPQARQVLRDVMTSAYPHLEEGVGYQLPSPSSLKKYRKCLYAICNNRMIHAMNECEEVHLLHDASTKKAKQIFQTGVKLVDKEGRMVSAPVGLNVLKNGESITEADAIDGHLHSDVGGGADADRSKVCDITSDGANGAGATSKIWIERRTQALQAGEDYKSMSDEEKAVLLECLVFRCGNHNLACMSSASFQGEEAVLKGLIASDESYNNDFDTTLATELCSAMDKQYDAQEDSDRPAVTQLLRACVFLFTPHGKNGEYYLNESDQILQWMGTTGAKEVAEQMHKEGLQESTEPKLEPLPAMKGSRQHVWLEMSYALVRNYRYYYAYIEQLRIRTQANKLVQKVHRGLKDKFLLAAIISRAMTWMNEIWPARFCINDLADRGSLHSVFMCLLDTIKGEDALMLEDDTSTFLERVAEKHPEWSDEISSFVSNAEKNNKIIMNYAKMDVQKEHVLAFRSARVAPMLASADRNVDDEMTSIKSKNAPTTTDSVESTFGTIDQVLHKTAASLLAAFGVAMAKRTHMFQTTVERKEQARPSQMRKRQKRGEKVEYGAEVDGGDSEKWDMCSIMAWPKERRFALYRSVLKNFKEECVEKPQQQVKEHDSEAYERKVQANEAAEKKLFRKAIKQQVWFSRKRAVLMKDLTAMLQGKKGGKLVDALRDQVNIRRYVDSIKDPIPKRTGGWLSGSLSEADVAEFRKHVEKMVKEEKYTKPPAIVPALQSEAAAPYASVFAQAGEKAREEKLKKLRDLLATCMKDGSFKTLLSSKTVPKKLKALKRRDNRRNVTGAERESLQGSEFDDEGITWKVLKVEWDDGLDSIIVFYYDLDSAKREGIDEDDLSEDHDYVEHSSLKEVLSWIG